MRADNTRDPGSAFAEEVLVTPNQHERFLVSFQITNITSTRWVLIFTLKRSFMPVKSWLETQQQQQN